MKTKFLILGFFLFTLPCFAASHYVDANTANPTPPYSTWQTAAATIQDAVDVAVPGDEIIVTNGVYSTGGRADAYSLTNRVLVDKPVVVRSMHGPQFTIIEGRAPEGKPGDGATRCVYLVGGATLSGFTLTNGATLSGPGRPDGGGAWCASSAAVLSNCVVSGNTAAYYGGGVYSGTLVGCILRGNAARDGGGAYNSVLKSCEVVGNSSTDHGGGAGTSTLESCLVVSNSCLTYGGGVFDSALTNCTVQFNSAYEGGGGYSSDFHESSLYGNSARFGGGARGSTLSRCRLAWNSADQGGGGYECQLFNSLVMSNSASSAGGGTRRGSFINCTVTANTARQSGGSSETHFVKNTILYGNYAEQMPNYEPMYVFGISNSCTEPLAPGPGNINANPLFVDPVNGDFRLRPISPCVNAGDAAHVSPGPDLEGNFRVFGAAVDMGAFELQSPALPTAPYVYSQPAGLTVNAGDDVRLIAEARGAAPLNYQWYFQSRLLEGATAPELLLPKVQLTDKGDYFAVITNISGSITTDVVRLLIVFPGTHYVNANGANPTPPYSTWQTAAATIQEAVDVAAPGGEILVTNGIYTVGGRAVHGTMTNRVAVAKPVRVLSINGPQVTTIQGYQVPGTTNGDAAIRCVYLTNGAFLAGFTLTGGATRATNHYLLNNESCGGGLLCEPSVSGWPLAMASNCVIFGNSAYVRGGGVHRGSLVDCLIRNNTAQGGGGVSSVTASRCVISSNTAGYGGGALYDELGSYCVLNNCLLINNRAAIGGGASACFMTNCTITANSAGDGGGVYGTLVTMSHRISHAYNCIVYGNTTESGTNMNYGGVACSFDSSCTAPIPEWGNGNISNDPLFVDAARGDYRLRPGSPCINAGSNNYVAQELDLAGLPRILGGTVDMGAFETAPGLIATRSGASLRISWPLWASEFVLQEAEASPSNMEWTDVTSPPMTQDGARVITVPIEGAKLFRLKKQ